MISGYLVDGKKGKGVLFLPWAQNTETSSSRWIGYNHGTKTITDMDNNIYKALLNIHTHPDYGPEDVSWRPSEDDIFNTRDQGIPAVVLAPKIYLLINIGLRPEGHSLQAPTNGGATRDLLKGYESLFRFLK